MSEPVAVLVLYQHELLGRGLEQLLAAEPGLNVRAVAVEAPGLLDQALTGDVDVLIFEDGGGLSLDDLLELTDVSIIVVTSLITGRVWMVRRDPSPVAPDDLVAAIIETCLAGANATGSNAHSTLRGLVGAGTLAVVRPLAGDGS